jgi:hypothetical protein
MPVIRHSEACWVMILFIGVSLHTYFIAPCAQEFFRQVCGVWMLPGSLAPRVAPALQPLPASSPLSLLSAHAPSSLSSWRLGLRCLQTSRTCSVSWGPLRTARTCHSARHGSGSSIPGSGGSVHGHRGRYCSPVLDALSLLFIGKRTIAGKRAVFSGLLEKTFPEGRKIPCRSCCGSGPWSGCGRHGAASEARGVREPGRPAAAAAAPAAAVPGRLRGCGAGRGTGAHPLSLEDR